MLQIQIKYKHPFGRIYKYAFVFDSIPAIYLSSMYPFTYLSISIYSVIYLSMCLLIYLMIYLYPSIHTSIFSLTHHHHHHHLIIISSTHQVSPAKGRAAPKTATSATPHTSLCPPNFTWRLRQGEEEEEEVSYE